MDISKLQAAVKARQEQIEAKKANGIKTAKIPAGTSRWRILPGWRKDSPEIYYHDFGSSWFKDADGKVTAVIVSEHETFGRPDPIADLIWTAYRAATDDKVKQRIKDLLPNRSVLVNAVQTSGAGADPTKVQLLPLPSGLAGKFHELLMARLEDGINILDLQQGRDVVITKSGTGLNTEYTMVDAAKETAVDPALMEQLTNIDAYIESKRQEGLQKGIGPVNDAIALALGATAPSARASLTSVLPAAAALAAPQPATVAMNTVAPQPVPVAPAPQPAAPVVAAQPIAPVTAGPTGNDILDDAELAALLGAIDQK